MDTEDNLEALFDAEDNDELLTELLNEHETEKTAKQKENDVDELALLNSFISDDEEEEGSKSVNAEDLKKMEDEYEELEKKMKALKDKMNTSGGEKCKADNTNKDNAPDESSIAPVEQKRSFFDAFGAGIDGAEIAEERNKETPKPPDLKPKISVSGSEPMASE
uniref:Uncharacterized protein n=1 Tax=Ciona savignyi TaxID=51511 RepID=H2YM18_CIOSA